MAMDTGCVVRDANMGHPAERVATAAGVPNWNIGPPRRLLNSERAPLAKHSGQCPECRLGRTRLDDLPEDLFAETIGAGRLPQQPDQPICVGLA